MRSAISSLSKNEDFKSLLQVKKKSNKYLTIFFKKLSGKNNKKINISFVTKKKLVMLLKEIKLKEDWEMLWMKQKKQLV